MASNDNWNIREGVWDNNPALVQLLGLCPLLAVSNNLVNAIGLSVATIAVITLSSLVVSLCRNHIQQQIRLPIMVLVIASLVTACELLLSAYLRELQLALGVFLPLIVTNCMILGRAESFSRRNSPLAAMLDGWSYGLGFAAVLITLAVVRELLSNGTLLHGFDRVIPELNITLQLLEPSNTLLVAGLPTGAFLTLAGLIALKNWRDSRTSQSSAPSYQQ